MIVLIFCLAVSVALVGALKILAYLLRESVLLAREELSSYECGFEHRSLSRVPFSLRYFFLTLVFLLFDLEILLILFLPSILTVDVSLFSMLLLVLFIILLYLRLIYE